MCAVIALSRLGFIARLYLVVAALSSRFEALQAAHGDNIACVACATMMEHTYTAISDYIEKEGNLMSLTERKDITLDFGEILSGMCKKREFADYTRRIRANCNQIDTTFPGVVAQAYAGDQAIEAQQYIKTHQVCVKILDYCDDDVNPTEGFANKCETCKAVMGDIEAVVYRSKEADYYRSRRHIYAIIDSACSSLVLRVPPNLLRELTDMCELLVADYEHEIAEAFIRDPPTSGRMICGNRGAGFCPDTHDTYDQVWLSIFHQQPWHESPFHDSPDVDEM